LRSSFALAAACSLQASLGPAPSLHLYVANNLEQSRGGSHSAPLSTAVHPSYGAIRTALRDAATLSIGIYVRTLASEIPGGSDSEARRRLGFRHWPSAERSHYLGIAACALALETRWAAGLERGWRLIAPDCA